VQGAVDSDYALQRVTAPVLHPATLDVRRFRDANQGSKKNHCVSAELPACGFADLELLPALAALLLTGQKVCGLAKKQPKKLGLLVNDSLSCLWQ
jgi:hypothetical protein